MRCENGDVMSIIPSPNRSTVGSRIQEKVDLEVIRELKEPQVQVVKLLEDKTIDLLALANALIAQERLTSNRIDISVNIKAVWLRYVMKALCSRPGGCAGFTRCCEDV